MAQVREILVRQPPARLYHYTGQSGLLGIIGQREIWASHTQYLNDTREFRHGTDILVDELDRLKGLERDNSALLDQMKAALPGIERVNVCVCSFSAEGDVLSQWRAYGSSTAGFSIGFSGQFLRGVAERLQFWLAPVLYEETEQRSFVGRLVEDVLAEDAHRDHRADDTVDRALGSNLVAYLSRYAPLLKHGSFAEEREWRIVSRPLPCSHERFGYRVGASMLIPYFRIPLSEELPFAVEEVVVGPTPHPDEAARAVEGLLERHDLHNVVVRVSSAPYRSW